MKSIISIKDSDYGFFFAETRTPDSIIWNFQFMQYSMNIKHHFRNGNIHQTTSVINRVTEIINHSNLKLECVDDLVNMKWIYFDNNNRLHGTHIWRHSNNIPSRIRMFKKGSQTGLDVEYTYDGDVQHIFCFTPTRKYTFCVKNGKISSFTDQEFDENGNLYAGRYILSTM